MRCGYARLEDLPAGPRGVIVGKLPHRDRAAFAAASSTSMSAVLEGCEVALWTAEREEVGQQVHEKLRGKVPRHCRGLVGWREPSTGMLYHRRAGGDARDASCIERMGLTESTQTGIRRYRDVLITPDMTGLRRLQLRGQRGFAGCAYREKWLPGIVAAGITKLDISCTDVQRVPPGMIELEDLCVSCCLHLDPDEWLPATSCAKLRVLKAGGSSVRRLPEDMTALETLDLTGSDTLAPDSFLPCSSASRLRKLILVHSCVERLPAGMAALEALDVLCCKNLDVDRWLPESSRARLRSLDAGGTSLRRVPDNMPALEELDLRHCEALLDNNSDWLPASSRDSVRKLVLSASPVTRVPENMPALEHLEMDDSRLIVDFLPASSAGRLRVLRASDSSLVRLPPDMRALEELDIVGCEQLAGADLLPLSSAARLRVLDASYSALQILPQGLASLEELNVTGCDMLDEDMDPRMAARLQAWRVVDSGLRLPWGMEQSRGTIQIA